MVSGQFLIRNRHHHHWYGRVVIPLPLRAFFNHRRELRLSLGTPDKRQALRRSRQFWLQCQDGFERLKTRPPCREGFPNTQDFLHWLARHQADERTPAHMANKILKQILYGEGVPRYIETTDDTGRRHKIDLGDPESERALAREIHENALALLERFKDNPAMLDRLLNVKDTEFSQPENQPETAISAREAIRLYIDKLESQGRKGKRLSQRTLLTYKDKLTFWQDYFDQRPLHSITRKELGEIQSWLVNLPASFRKRSLSVDTAVKLARDVRHHQYDRISDKTRAEYLGQLKGLLEYAYSNGFITAELSAHIEMPNTRQSKAIERLPFTTGDLQKIFPGKDYGVDFGTQRAGLDYDTKFWFPLLAAFTGARLEELAQLRTDDIRTCPDTGIIYAMIDNRGAAADGQKKRTKNLNSVRPIPIHSTLIAIGFMAYVAERQKDRKNGSLFKLKRDKQGRLAKGVSNWFSRVDKRKDGNLILGYIERRGVTSKGVNEAGERWSKSFHSFRHTVIDNLRGKQLANGEYIREPDIALVVGHEKTRLETASYGKDRMQLRLRKAVIEALDYPSVDFVKVNW